MRSRLIMVCLVTSLATLCGCRDSNDAKSFDIPLREPGQADLPNGDAVENFLRRTNETPDSHSESLDWPFLFGPNRTSHTTHGVRPLWPEEGPQLVWEISVGTGYGSPVTAGGRVVFSHRVDDEEWIQCLATHDGEEIWCHRTQTDATCDFEYSAGPYSTPLIDVESERVFHFGGQGRLIALDLVDGDLIWERNLHQEFSIDPEVFPPGATPALDQGQLILSLGAADREAGIIAIRATDGVTNWRCTDHAAGYTTPFVSTIHKQRFAFVMTAVGLVCLNPDTGAVDWEIEHFSRAPMSYNSVSPMVHDDHVLFVTGPGPGAICIRVQPDRSYETVWKNRRLIDCQYNNLMLADGYVYGFTSAGQGGAELRCVDLKTGELQWRYHSVLRRGQGLIAGRSMIVLGENGHLAALEATPHAAAVLSFTDKPLLSGPCFGSPAITRDRVLLKDEERLAAFAID